MKPARSAWPFCIACLALLGLTETSALAQDKTAETETARRQLEDRLLEAELLEVSAGDLERAMAVYRELVDGEGTPEPVRARALLYLARCHRKLGQVDRAQELLDRLVEKHAEEREVLRQARAFLRELRGEKLNPEFDWLAELGKNPEIQARVFDLAMDMVDLNSESGQTARRQLLALGTLTVPVLEKMVTTSRDTRHRHHLALLLVQLAKVEYWKVLLDPESPVPTSLNYRSKSDAILADGLDAYFESIPELSAGDRARLLELLSQIPEDDATEPYRQLILLRAGEVREFAKAIPALEIFLRSPKFDVFRLFAERVKEDPAAPEAVADRLVHPECGAHDQYYQLLEEHAPGALGVAHHQLMLERRPGHDQRRALIAKLEEAGAFDALEEFVRGDPATNLVDYFWETYVEAGKPAKAPAGWAPILRKAGPIKVKLNITVTARRPQGRRLTIRLEPHGGAVLHLMAESNDAFIGELEEFLQRLQDQAPDYRGYGKRYTWPWLTGSWKPSPRYLEAMQGLLETEHPFSRVVALEALSVAVPLNDDTLGRVETIARTADDDVVREVALYTLVRHFAARPETGRRVASTLMTEVLKRLDAGPDATRSTALAGLAFGSVVPEESQGTLRRRDGRRVRRVRTGRPGYSESARWVVRQAQEESPDVALELYSYIVDLTADAHGRRFHAWFRENCIANQIQANALLLEKAGTLEGTARRVDALQYLHSRREVYESELLSFLKSIATDPAIETEKRLDAIRSGDEESLEWFDWPEFLKSDDPLLDELLRYTLPPDRRRGGPHRRFSQLFSRFVRRQDSAAQDAIWPAALGSPHEAVRAFAYGSYPAERADAAEVFARGLKDPSESVRWQAKDRIVNTTLDDMLPLLLTLLEDDEREWRLKAIEALERLALQESVEPLVRLLDDSDFEIRGKALEALKAIRATLEEKREWKALLEGVKKAPGGTR